MNNNYLGVIVRTVSKQAGLKLGVITKKRDSTSGSLAHRESYVSNSSLAHLFDQPNSVLVQHDDTLLSMIVLVLSCRCYPSTTRMLDHNQTIRTPERED